MKIGFVAEPYEETGASGMGYMVFELLRHLPQAAKGHEFTIYSSLPIDKTLVSVPIRNIIVPRSFIGKFFWFLTTKENIDVLLFVAPLLPLIAPKRIKSVVICPELGSQKITPKTSKGKGIAFIRDHILMPRTLSRAVSIIAISQATKKDITRYYNVPEKKIHVVYVGYQNLSQLRKTAPPIDNAIQPYFFFTGRVKYRKNVHNIVSAFIMFKKRTHADCKLVIAGKSGGIYRQMMLAQLEQHGLQKNVIFTGYLSPEALCTYYSHALAFVFPSLNEGFGMPVVEAMSLGTPVITSNISSLPEAAGGAALLVDPHDTEAISRAMEQVYRDGPLRNELIRKGYERAKELSWPKAARGFLEIIEHHSPQS